MNNGPITLAEYRILAERNDVDYAFKFVLFVDGWDHAVDLDWALFNEWLVENG